VTIRRGAARGLAVLTPTILLLGLGLAAPAMAQAPADFTRSATQAITKTFPGLKVREHSARSARSLLDAEQRVRVESAAFTGRGQLVGVVRTVGADRMVAAKEQVNGKTLGTVQVRRPGAGVRTAVVSSTADQWGPGLTVLAWSERSGVNYQLVARGASQQELVRVAKALPRDATRATAKARTTIARSTAPVPSQVDARLKQPQRPDRGQVTIMSASNGYVEGADTVNDDLGNESTLCSGCSYWNSNYTGMWQNILWADGKLAQSGIDCQFGSGTASATAAWQRAEGLSADGIVGSNSRGRADNYFSLSSGIVTYWGSSRFVDWERASGRYYFNGPAYGLVAYNRNYTADYC
jgi:peptidoglycan hydrolase-like protein with peptidoglycan-binding domain